MASQVQLPGRMRKATSAKHLLGLRMKQDETVENENGMEGGRLCTEYGYNSMWVGPFKDQKSRNKRVEDEASDSDRLSTGSCIPRARHLTCTLLVRLSASFVAPAPQAEWCL